MRRIKIAQIGMGHDHAWVVLDSVLKQTDLFEVVGFAVPESERTEFAHVIEKYRGRLPLMGVEEILNYPGLDAVLIETEEENLTRYALMAAQKGLHIHMDKPGGLEMAQFEQLVTTARANGCIFHMGYMYRYNPFVTEALEKVKSGALGKIYSVEAQMSCWHSKEKSQWLEQFPGGMLFFLGCHLIDLVLQIQGIPQKIIPLSTCTGAKGVTSKDLGMAVFEYQNGVSFVKTCSSEYGGFNRRQLVICGTKGTIEMKPFEYLGENRVENGSELYTDMREIYDNDWFAWGEKKTSAAYDRYETMMASFAQMVRGEKENPWSYDYELQLYRVICRACGME
ncbi:MAG: Gfo/Idh/MocA family oxidoreductase [Ruminococcaceae bacterium]|nr:Gfo/Idh/MocA family oxidoreductase [Oscillospiraceae bacterium]